MSDNEQEDDDKKADGDDEKYSSSFNLPLLDSDNEEDEMPVKKKRKKGKEDRGVRRYLEEMENEEKRSSQSNSRSKASVDVVELQDNASDLIANLSAEIDAKQGARSSAAGAAADDDDDADAAQAAKKLPKWRPVALQVNPFDGQDELEPEYDRAHPEYFDYCFFCWCEMTRSDLVQNQRYKYLYAFIVSNWGRTNMIWMMNRAQDLYNATVRKKTKRDWPFFRRNIFEHFISHDLSPRFILELQELLFRNILRKMVQCGDLFEESLVMPGLVRAKPGRLKTFKEMCEYHRKIHRDVVDCRLKGDSGKV